MVQEDLAISPRGRTLQELFPLIIMVVNICHLTSMSATLSNMLSTSISANRRIDQKVGTRDACASKNKLYY